MYYVITNLLGVLVKESLIFMLIFYICYEFFNKKLKLNFKDIIFFLLQIIPIIITFFIIRLLITPSESTYDYMLMFSYYGIPKLTEIHFSSPTHSQSLLQLPPQGLQPQSISSGHSGLRHLLSLP